MIKILKLQKAVMAIVFGLIALVAYKIMDIKHLESSIYMLELAGLLFVAGALLFLYPVIFAKKDKEGNVELDPEQQEERTME